MPTVEGLSGRVPLSDAILRGERQKWRGLISATITVPRHKCLIRELTLPRSALARAEEVLRLDLARTTPFRIEDVFTDWYHPVQDNGGEQTTVHQVILKRSFANAAIDAVRSARIPIKSIHVIAEDGRVLPVNLLARQQRAGAPVGTVMTRVLVAMAGGVVALNLAAFAVTAVDLRAATVAADADLQTATADAQVLRKQVGEVESSARQLRQPRMRKIGTNPVVAIWDDVTRILPNSTSLTDFRVDNGTVQLDGYSANASELIGLLAASPLFANVAFASPVTRDVQRGTERFQIKFQTTGSAHEAEPRAGAKAK